MTDSRWELAIVLLVSAFFLSVWHFVAPLRRQPDHRNIPKTLPIQFKQVQAPVMIAIVAATIGGTSSREGRASV